MSFEENLKNLEQIVNELEKGDLTLDKSIEKFETGMKIASSCNKILEEAEKKITMLVQNGENIEEKNFLSEEET